MYDNGGDGLLGAGEGCGIRPGDGVLTINNVYCAR
jgi:hypothetical protein